MGKAVKIAISLPSELLEAADQARHMRGETRSEFFRYAVSCLLRHEQERDAIERYLQGYREHPETEDEITEIHRISDMVLGREPWE